MRSVYEAFALALAVCAAANSQTLSSPKLEFDVASINIAEPLTGHFYSPASSVGGPGTADPTLFRCTNCYVAFLITKAFGLQRYQFLGQASLPQTTYDITARVPEGTTPEQFVLMLQNLLRDRFALSYHYDKKQMQGYELVVAKNGPKLRESKGPAKPSGNEVVGAHQEGGAWHGTGNDGGHGLTRPGLMVFRGQAKYRGDYQTTADLARMISDQLAKPVDDHTSLQGKYDITLNWADDGSHAASHSPGGALSDHGDHGGAGLPSDGPTGPTLVGALQTQLGLTLEGKKATASIFVVDHVDKSPTAN